MPSKRNYALDFLKCLAALMVVFLHYNKVKGDYGILYSETIRSITRCAVPLFFMITGYYLPVIVANEGLQKQIKKVLKLALGATAFYLAYRLIDAYFKSSATEWLASHYTAGTLFSWIVLNDDPTGYHLWYLYGLLYSLLIYAGIYRLKKSQYIPVVTLFMFLFVIIANYTGCIFIRNYLLGIPCIGCGIMVREGRLKIGYRKILIPISILLVVSEMLFSFYVFRLTLDIYIFSIPLALCMLTWGIDNPSIGQGTVWAYIGMKLSAYIYIFHVFVDNMICVYVDYDSLALQILHPFILFMASTLFTYLYVKSKERISKQAKAFVAM